MNVFVNLLIIWLGLAIGGCLAVAVIVRQITKSMLLKAVLTAAVPAAILIPFFLTDSVVWLIGSMVGLGGGVFVMSLIYGADDGRN